MSKPAKVDSSWMKRSSAIQASDKKNAVTGSTLGTTGTKSKNVELKEFPTGASRTTTESDKTSLASSSARKRRPSHSRASDMGHQIGATRLHWLKRNWILCGLIVFALFGCLMAIIMFSLPLIIILVDKKICKQKEVQ